MENALAAINPRILTIKPYHLRYHHSDNITVRRAGLEDLRGIYDIACTVGKARKDPYQGFLVDDYTSDPRHYRELFRRHILELEHFYVAAAQERLLGFLMAYTREQWLKDNPEWLEEVLWHPGFDQERTRRFALVGKTAIRAHLTSRGIGSRLYERLIRDIRAEGIRDIFAETVIDSVPNFASLSFRKKQNYRLAGVRYEEYRGEVITDLIYHKSV